jgi:hypothetical protein
MLLGKLLEEMSLSLGVDEFAVASKAAVLALRSALVALERSGNTSGDLENAREFPRVALE